MQLSAEVQKITDLAQESRAKIHKVFPDSYLHEIALKHDRCFELTHHKNTATRTFPKLVKIYV